MNSYHVTYFYLATGMEGQADIRDYGIVHAESADEAKTRVATATTKDPDAIDWVKGCLSAKEIH